MTIQGATSMTRFPRILPLVWLFAAFPVHAVGLPDTGQDTCYNDNAADVVSASNAASVDRDAGTHPRQDCRYGRDPAAAAGALTKTGAGAKGFDYTKIANNGTTLAAGAALGTGPTDWACTKDNITGLTWEVKTATSTDLRYSGHTYRWYNTDGTTNGGNAGSVGSDTCNTTLPGGLCNTEAFVTVVNAAAVCSFSDWRMPTRRELLTLIAADASSPSIAPTYFPNTPALTFWSGSGYALSANAWSVEFGGGNISNATKTTASYVRLVRGTQF
jgi:Protein of unknown function (DUF1566)